MWPFKKDDNDDMWKVEEEAKKEILRNHHDAMRAQLRELNKNVREIREKVDSLSEEKNFGELADYLETTSDEVFGRDWWPKSR